MDYAQFDFHDGTAMLIESNTEELEQLALFLSDDAQADPQDYINWLESSEIQKGGNTGLIRKIEGGRVEIQLDPIVYGSYQEPVKLTETQFNSLLTQWRSLLKAPPKQAKLIKEGESYSFVAS